MGAQTRLSVNPISVNSGKSPPKTFFMSLRAYRGTVLMGSGVYFVRGVEIRLVNMISRCSASPLRGLVIQVLLCRMILEVGELVERLAQF